MASKKNSGSLTGRYKKQHGLHHKHGDQYLKVYWPYIPVALVVFTGILASLFILNSKNHSTASANVSSVALLNATNDLRSSNDLSTLTINSQLTTAAQIKANDMALKNYWSPVSPSGQTPWQIIQTSGYKYTLAGENLAYGFSNSQSLLSAWASSQSHKANVLNSNYTNVGFGIAQAPDYQGKGPQTIVVALYADPASSNTQTSISNNTSGAYTSATLIEPSSQAIARVETLSGNHSYISIFVVGLIAGTAMAIIVIRHALVLKKWAIEGEQLIIKHPIIDLVLIIVVIGAASLNQTVGIIN